MGRHLRGSGWPPCHRLPCRRVQSQAGEGSRICQGQQAARHQRGNKSYEGSITLLQSEYESLKQACGGDILDASFDIVVAYGNASKGDAIVTDILVGAEFTEDKTAWKQGDKFQEKVLPFIFLDKKSA